MTMTIGIDFDNTIVRYDELFHRAALERGLVPPETPRTKESVRDYLRACGREPDWTELQGYVYGARMKDVEAFPGALDFFAAATRTGVPVYIISHKTKFPYRGPRYDLHAAAREWLDSRGFFDKARIGLGADQVFFVETKEEKLRRIGQLGCTHFIDDLVELLSEDAFPRSTKRILFSPGPQPAAPPFMEAAIRVVHSWREIQDYFQIHAPAVSTHAAG
jgi:hypothetical protein